MAPEISRCSYPLSVLTWEYKLEVEVRTDEGIWEQVDDAVLDLTDKDNEDGCLRSLIREWYSSYLLLANDPEGSAEKISDELGTAFTSFAQQEDRLSAEQFDGARTVLLHDLQVLRREMRRDAEHTIEEGDGYFGSYNVDGISSMLLMHGIAGGRTVGIFAAVDRLYESGVLDHVDGLMIERN